jgi:hypothetical protein
VGLPICHYSLFFLPFGILPHFRRNTSDANGKCLYLVATDNNSKKERDKGIAKLAEKNSSFLVCWQAKPETVKEETRKATEFAQRKSFVFDGCR